MHNFLSLLCHIHGREVKDNSDYVNFLKTLFVFLIVFVSLLVKNTLAFDIVKNNRNLVTFLGSASASNRETLVRTEL